MTTPDIKSKAQENVAAYQAVNDVLTHAQKEELSEAAKTHHPEASQGVTRSRALNEAVIELNVTAADAYDRRQEIFDKAIELMPKLKPAPKTITETQARLRVAQSAAPGPHAAHVAHAKSQGPEQSR